MKKYSVYVSMTKTEFWEVEAENEEQAKLIFEDKGNFIDSNDGEITAVEVEEQE